MAERVVQIVIGPNGQLDVQMLNGKVADSSKIFPVFQQKMAQMGAELDMGAVEQHRQEDPDGVEIISDIRQAHRHS